jgi:acetylornithine deacetylase
MSPVGKRSTSLEILADLVSFDTESDKSNLPIIDYIEAYLSGLGVASVRFPSADGAKAALFATVGPADRGGVLLSGHTDVVPVEGQAWTTDPYTLRVADGRAYGRGSVDMKGFDAIVLAAVPDMLEAPLSTPIHMLFSYDEETSCLGSTDTIARFGLDLPMPRAVIVGEPTDLHVADAHKGIITFVTTVHGFEAHSSKPFLGANAIPAAAELVTELTRLGDEMMARGDPSGRFDPPFTTVHVGQLQGGTARNILARQCWFNWEFRSVPGQDPREIPDRFARHVDEVALPLLNRYGPFGKIETIVSADVPGLDPDPGNPAEALAFRIAGRNSTITVPYATEAGHFQKRGIPTVVCGPGSINQAHQPDEYITLEAIAAGDAFMMRLVAECR